ncbi:MAG: acetyl-CoA C-acetyltransferase [Planctomycetaceae bacterium]
MSDAFIIAAARTPIGAFRGAFKTLSSTDLGAASVAEVLSRSGLDAAAVDEVIMGNVIGAGVGQAPARQAALKGGLPTTVPALTVNKVCGSGLKSVMLASQAVRLGDAKAIIAGGMESMTNAPHLVPGAREGFRLGDGAIVDSMVSDGLTCAFESCHMGMHAEHIANAHNVTREDQDNFALQSQQRATKAVEAGIFDDEIVSVTVKTRKAETVVSADECVRPETTLESLQGLRTVFDREGTVTAGNASTLSDGAAAVMVVDEETANASSSPIKARIVSSFTSGTDPKDLFIAPVAAVQGALEKAGLTTTDIDLFEINEAFASQMVACVRGLELDEAKVNIYGGGISLGHPIGASGARTLVTLLYAMQKNDAKRGVVSLCLGGGNAVAMVVARA